MTVATVWSANLPLMADRIVCPTVPVNGLFFKVTQAGFTGAQEPNWPKKVGSIVYDGGVIYKAYSSIFEDLSKVNPTSVIELFVLEFNETIHGTNAGIPTSNDETNIYRFHAGTNRVENNIVWAGKTYQRFPVMAEGFAFQRGQVPRPKLIVSNALGTISAILQAVNAITPANDLTGAKVSRVRTLARFLDHVNFDNTNPFGDPDPNAEFPRDIYNIDRKSAENRDVVEFELAAAFDLAGVRIPKRQCTRDLFPAIGTFVE